MLHCAPLRDVLFLEEARAGSARRGLGAIGGAKRALLSRGSSCAALAPKSHFASAGERTILAQSGRSKTRMEGRGSPLSPALPTHSVSRVSCSHALGRRACACQQLCASISFCQLLSRRSSHGFQDKEGELRGAGSHGVREKSDVWPCISSYRTFSSHHHHQLLFRIRCSVSSVCSPFLFVVSSSFCLECESEDLTLIVLDCQCSFCIRRDVRSVSVYCVLCVERSYRTAHMCADA